jgi:hypothetical protein
MATLHITVEDHLLADLVAQLEQSPMWDKFSIRIEPQLKVNGNGTHLPTNGQENQKLTHEELMALPLDQRLQYFDAHGGVFAVMVENGYGLTEQEILEWERKKEENDQYLDSLTWEVALNEIYGSL